MTGIRAANRFSYFAAAAAAASRSSTQSSGGWDDVVDPKSPVTQVLEEDDEEEGKDPSPGVVVQVPSKKGTEKEEKEEEGEGEDVGQDDIMPGSFEPAHREPSLPWTEVVGKNINDFLTLLHVK